ncbi:MAG: hypothetical protein JST87_15675 [Bacteroidetes bacterium]|nr:hypothetical protein [Bacteroidota bacterium]MBS1935456.1 hypothetical protein [Bacteroidota bacterium]
MKTFEITISSNNVKIQPATESKRNLEFKRTLKRNPFEEREEVLKELNSRAAKYPFCITYKTKNHDPL